MKAIEDRRVRRTRGALGAALVELVLEKGFHAVTVEQIVERADVGRATFYVHYRDKEDLLVGVVRDLALEQVRLIPPAEGSAGFPLLRLFEQVERERDACRVILRGEGDGRALREFTEIIGELVEEVVRSHRQERGAGLAAGPAAGPVAPLDVMVRAWTGEIVGVLTWWIEGRTGYSAAEVARHLGAYWARGRS